MKEYLKYALIILIVLLFQVYWFPALTIKDCKPDLSLIVLIILSINKDLAFGLILGLITGILNFYFTGLGLWEFIIANTIIGGLSGLLGKTFPKNNFIVYIFSVFWMTILYEIVMWILRQPKKFNFAYNAEHILFQVIYNIILACLIFFIYNKTTSNKYNDYYLN